MMPVTLLPPVVAVDVDGVLNALTSNPSPQRVVHDVVMPREVTSPFVNPRVIGKTLPVSLDAEDGKFLNACASLGAHVVWCTTWENVANTHLAPLLDTGPWDFLQISDYREANMTSYAKLWALDDTFPDQPVLWIDDDNWFIRDQLRSNQHSALVERDQNLPLWVDENSRKRVLLSTRPELGLTGAQRVEVLSWVADHSGRLFSPDQYDEVISRGSRGYVEGKPVKAFRRKF